MAATDAAIDRAWMERTFRAVKNWGRWGEDDELGALNLVTPAKRLQAAAAVRDGIAVSCALDLAVEPGPHNPHPALHHMTLGGDALDEMPLPGLESSADFIGVAFHGMAVSHIDALCHVFVDGRMYNDRPASDVRSTGARSNSIAALRDGIVTRGVLLDAARLRGAEWVEPGSEITPDELERAEREQGVALEPGDALIVHNGRDAHRAAHGPRPPWEGLAGLHPACVPWLHERGVAVLGGDGIQDPLPGRSIAGWPMPVHQCGLVAMGLHLLDNLHTAALARACADRGRWEFLFVVAPLRIAGGTGSPVNPIAML